MAGDEVQKYTIINNIYFSKQLLCKVWNTRSYCDNSSVYCINTLLRLKNSVVKKFIIIIIIQKIWKNWSTGWGRLELEHHWMR